jgi:cation transporter-like permease
MLPGVLRFRHKMTLNDDLEVQNHTFVLDVDDNTKTIQKLSEQNNALEETVNALRNQVEILKNREAKYISALHTSPDVYVVDETISSSDEYLLNDNCPMEPKISFWRSLYDRALWLIGLLIFQSCSSFILSANEVMLKEHTSIIFFLTMLVGAGGNAGNQSAVRVIRGIALGTISRKTYWPFFKREFRIAICLSILLGFTGLCRALISRVSYVETITITCALMTIVLISVITGALLPILLHQLDIDPAHSSTSIQVIPLF